MIEFLTGPHLQPAAYGGGGFLLVFMAYQVKGMAKNIDKLNKNFTEVNKLLAVLIERDEAREKELDRIRDAIKEIRQEALM